MEDLTAIVGDYARLRGVQLAPHWRDELAGRALSGSGALDGLCLSLGWHAPTPLGRRPRAHLLPAMMFSATGGWAIAEQWEAPELLRVRRGNQATTERYDPRMSFYTINFPDPARSGDELSAASVFRKAVFSRKGALLTAFLATVMTNIIALVTSLYSMQVYDRVIPRQGYSTLWVLTAGVLFALTLDFLLRTVRSLLIEQEAAQIDTEVSEFFFARAQGVRLDARSGGVGTMAAQLRGLEQVRSIYSSGSLFLLADLPFALFFLLVIYLLGGWIVLVPLAVLPVSLLLAWLLARLIRGATARAQVSSFRKNGLLVEGFDAAETVKANLGGWYMLSRWNRLVDDVVSAEEPVRRWSATAQSVFSTLQQIAYVGLIAVGALAVGAGQMTTGALVAAAIIGGRVNGPLIAQLPSLIVQWGYARSSLSALDAILKQPQDRAPGMMLLRPTGIAGAVRLEDVEFAYPGARGGLQVPRLDIRAGERVGIVGGIGSGKSTLLRLLAGLYAPQRGTITLDGLDLGHIAEDVLRRHIGYLPQDFRLVNGSLRDNLLLGMSDPGDRVVMEAAATTGLAHLIAGHPLGLDLMISEGGRGLSGGQRTLTGLTRLLLAQPKLWLLDEPTSNLDQGTEAAVLGSIQSQLAADSTLILVTHKMSLLSMVDRLIVMQSGRISHDGPCEAVIEALRTSGTATVQPASASLPPRQSILTGGAGPGSITAGGFKSHG